MRDILWTDDDIIWSDNPYFWNHVVEITAVQDVGGGFPGSAFVRMHPKRRQIDKDKITWKPKKLKSIKVICLVDDEFFEQTNYINKKLRVEMDGDYIVTEAKKSEIKPEDVKWALKHKGKMRVEIKNIVIK
jgi:hypothetical protein